METLRITKKNFQDEEFPHELFLTTCQKTKIRNASANNISTDVKLSEAQLSKTIQSLMEVAFALAKNVLAPLATMTSASAIDGAIQRKLGGGAWRRYCKGRKKNHFSHFK